LSRPFVALKHWSSWVESCAVKLGTSASTYSLSVLTFTADQVCINFQSTGFHLCVWY